MTWVAWVRAMKVAPAQMSCFIGLTGMSIAPVGSVFDLETNRRGRRGLLLRQAIDEIVHDEVSHVDVLARAVIEMVAADGEAVAVAAEEKDVEIGPGQADAGGERDGAPVNEMRAVAVHEIGEARGTTDPGEGDDLLVIELPFLDHFVIGGEDGEVAAAGAPGRVIGGDGFLGEFLADEFQGGVRRSRGGGGGTVSGWWCLVVGFGAHFEISKSLNR